MEFTIRQLKEIAKGLSIKGYSRMVKADLYAAIEATGYWEPTMEPIPGQPEMGSQEFSRNTEVSTDDECHNGTMNTNTTTEDTIMFDYNDENVQSSLEAPFTDAHLVVARYLGAAAGRTLTMAAYGYYWAAIALYVFIRNGLPVWVPVVKGILTEVAISFSYGLDTIKLALVWFVMQQFGTSECLSGLQAKLRMVYIDTHESMYV